ncbi:MAG: nicotinamide mononucleotide deamidase-related protein [Nitrososphaerota archaeon]|nr:nicotinamide mononucleotide deamidase-related protein [Aigarchaeota archaeon]MDW8076793.1 nicotinamide mononucleotide deamidase-related protein [Nitrososphaerota archaeon]
MVRKTRNKQTTFEIISIGNELLIGRVVNTNANWLAKKITEIGGFVRRITDVRDDLSEISSAVREALKRDTEWIITSGGLGPTFDDMTLIGVAKAIKRPIKLNKQAYQMIVEKYKDMFERGIIKSLEITPERRKMAELPAGAIPLRNRVGTAPGVLVKFGRQRIACLPGVPAELMDIFENELLPIIQKSIKRTYTVEKILIAKDIIESALAPAIKEVISRHPTVYIKSHPKGRESGVSIIELHLTATAPSSERIEIEIEQAVQELKEKIVALGGTVEQ